MNNCDIWSALAQRLQPELGPRLGDDGFHLQINRNLGDELAGGLTVSGQDGTMTETNGVMPASNC